MTDSLAPGAIIADRYQLERLLGEGGMGAVWAATHTLTKKHVALKFLKGAASGNEQLLRRFLREARAASAVNHPNVLGVHDILQQPDGSPVMVLDLLNGKSLAEHLEEVRAMSVDELARVLVPVISAVGTAHAAGIVHRDLKPDNIFLHMRADGEMEPKVLDFGIAKLNAKEGEAAETAHLTQTGAMLGTPFYMSPEQVFGERDIDQRADVWAMGVIIYECLSGRRPVDGENYGQLFRAITMGYITPLEQVAPQLPADITRLVGRMLQGDKKQRPADLREPYEVLSKYSLKKAASFDGAAAPLETERPPPPSSAPLAFEETGVAVQTPASSPPNSAALAFEETGLAAESPPGASQSAAGAFSRTSDGIEPETTPTLARRFPLWVYSASLRQSEGGRRSTMLRHLLRPTRPQALPLRLLPLRPLLRRRLQRSLPQKSR